MDTPTQPPAPPTPPGPPEGPSQYRNRSQRPKIKRGKVGAPPGNKNAKGNKAQLKFKPEYSEMARRFCLLKVDATDEDLGKFFEVTAQTIYNWRKTYPEFKEAVLDGKERADTQVANALHKRAIGYEHEAVKIFANTTTGNVVQVPYIEHYPPDAGAAKMWLTNRTKHWKDKQVVEIEDPDDLLAKVLGIDKDKLPE